MCGIGGIFRRGPMPPDNGPVLETMADALSPRGPDGRGTWFDAEAGIGLSHTRLSVLDLSPRGAQPMTDSRSRGWIVYNGEVYNFRELRAELKGQGFRFKSDTDTEVVLAACLTWGISRALNRFLGMFAFALWISNESALYLARDRIGKKPLYYGWAGEDLVFGSELKALCVHPGFKRNIDPEALEQYLMLQYIPSPRTVYSGARKLLAGHYLRFDREGEDLVSWWDVDEAENCCNSGLTETKGPEWPELFDDSVCHRLVSDVPLGAFLSGGMDSSLVVAAMGRVAGTPPSTFTVSYEEGEYDEGPAALSIARHFGTDHHQVRVNSSMLLESILDLPHVYDEPLSDPSALPMMVLSRLAREHVTVILSGDGGDELFGGYDRYMFVQRYLSRFFKAPPSVRKAAAAVLASIPSRSLARAYGLFRSLTGKTVVENFAGKWEKLLRLLLQDDPVSVYQTSIGIFPASETQRILGKREPPSLPGIFHRCLEDRNDLSFLRRMMDLDMRTFLTDDVLTKVDRASMAAGLEVRVPFLDHRIVSWSRTLADEMLYSGGRGKAPLRRLAERDLPGKVAHRPKMGFTMPLDSWFRNELKDLLSQYLGEGARVLESYFDPDYVNRLVREHLTGQCNHHEKIWNLLVFALWEERWKPAAG